MGKFANQVITARMLTDLSQTCSSTSALRFWGTFQDIYMPSTSSTFTMTVANRRMRAASPLVALLASTRRMSRLVARAMVPSPNQSDKWVSAGYFNRFEFGTFHE